MDKPTYAGIQRAALARIAERKTKTFASADELINYLREVAVDRDEEIEALAVEIDRLRRA